LALKFKIELQYRIKTKPSMDIQPANRTPPDIEKLTEQARSNSAVYKTKLLALAIVGDLALTVAQVLPFVLPALLAAMFFDVALFYWLTAALAVFLAWVFRPSYRTEGGFVSQEQAPALFSEIESLRQTMDVHYPMQVRIDDSFNASALQTRGIFGLFGTKCVLTLGLPLLIALDQTQLRAVLAHEFGHFSRRHGLFGHWLYRARIGWLSFASQVSDSDAAFDRAAAWYAQRFVPFFIKRSFVHSRQCEYEADADAAVAVGNAQFAQALSRVALLGRHWDALFQKEMTRLQTEAEDAPLDYFERYEESIARLTDQDLRELLALELEERTNWIDTHPSLPDRLAAIRQTATSVQSSGSPAIDLLGPCAEQIKATQAAAWALRVGADWQLEHAWRSVCAVPLSNTDSQVAANWPLRRRIERIGALAQMEHANFLSEAFGLREIFPDDEAVKYFVGVGLLQERDVKAITLLESIARAHPALRLKIFSIVSMYYANQADDVQARRWRAWADAAAPGFAQAGFTAVSKFLDGHGQTGDVDQRWRACFAKMVGSPFQPVTRIWVGEVSTTLQYSSEREPLHVDAQVLALEIDPVQLATAKRDEDAIAARYVEFACRMFGPDVIVAAHTFFTTQAQPAACTDSLLIAKR
jgi:Zn-dependent protease with chaperone function